MISRLGVGWEAVQTRIGKRRRWILGGATPSEMTAMLMLPEAGEEELLLGKVGGGFVVTGGWSMAWAFGSGACADEVAFGGGGCRAELVPAECSAARASRACWCRMA